MSVPKSKQSISDFEFYIKLQSLYIDIVRFLAKEFGERVSTNDLRLFTAKAKMEPQDIDDFNYLIDKYKIDIQSSYPLYIINYFRSKILECLDMTLSCTIQANSIYPYNTSEYYNRRNLQDFAIANLELLKQRFILLVKIFNIQSKDTLNKYIYYNDRIDEVIKLLKDWRKENNKLYTMAVYNENQANIHAKENIIKIEEKHNKKKNKEQNNNGCAL